MALRRVVRAAVMTCRSLSASVPALADIAVRSRREDLDDDHASAAARTGARLHAWLVRCGGLLLLRLNDAGQSTEQLAGVGDVSGTVAVGEEAIVADPVEALGQHVHQEAADELMRGERHRLPAVGAVGAVDAVVLPPEGDGIGVGGDQSAVGDGDAMGGTREIRLILLPTRERTLGVKYPCDRRSPGKENGM